MENQTKVNATSASNFRPPQSPGGHICISPPDGSRGNSPPCSTGSSGGSGTCIDHGSSPEHDKSRLPESESPVVVVNRAVSEEPVVMKKQTGRVGGVESGPQGVRRSLSVLRSAKRTKMVKRAALGFRIFGFLFCLVSFSVMAADVNQGWALDSFYRYKEFRYCISGTVIGFVYSGAQAMALSYDLATGKYAVQHKKPFRYYFDFAFDQQMIAYILISASSSAAVRIDDWKSNWGKDKFPDMAGAAVSMSFLAFVALAFSSLISGYTLCAYRSP